MPVFDHAEFDGHDQVLFCADPDVDLTAIIAIHSTALGPAAGGCRMHPYATTDDALTDVLRLSRGMSYKNALAGLPLGGGKAVIVADPSRPDKADLLRAFSRHVQDLGGRYWTAIDVGIEPSDADIIAERCDYTFTRASQYEPGFNPSAFTSLGGFTGIRAAVSHLWGRDELVGLRVGIQGLGATGSGLAELLHEAGARLVVADVRSEAVADIVHRFGAEAVPPDTIHAQDVDVFAPCALGAGLNDETIPDIKAKIICGLANNQLAEARHGETLRRAGIVYVPDYVVNAGGMIGAGSVIYGTATRQESTERILGLYDTIRSILETADTADLPPSEVADRMALERIAAARGA